MNIVESKTRDFFGEETPLKKAAECGGRTYEKRHAQEEMAFAISKALGSNQHACIEAPTGVGKSFAYLVPAIYHALATETKVIVSTHTINLQEQLIRKDLKILKEIMDVDFRVILAKGRENYVCLRRLDSAWESPEDFLFSDQNLEELNRIKAWSIKSSDGTRSDLSPIPEGKVWTQVNCEPGNCSKQKCPFFKQCYYMKMKMDLGAADLIVTNHSLYFVDMAMKAIALEKEEVIDGILPNYSAVIFDEAHTMEDCAAMHLGVRCTTGGFFHLLNRLEVPNKNMGLLKSPNWRSAKLAVERLRGRANLFFEQLTDWVLQQENNPLRYTMPGHIPHILQAELKEVDEELRLIVDEEEGDLGQEIESVRLRLFEYAESMEIFLNMSEPDFVYWFEVKHFDNGHNNLSMYGVPVEVNKVLSPMLFNQKFSVTMTSATLAVNNNLHFFLKRIGAFQINELILDSPFDYDQQMEIHMPYEMALPKDFANFLPQACEHIQTYIKKTGGKTMVLFTSYSMMSKVADELNDFFYQNDIELLMQGQSLSNSHIIEEFKNNESSVIFGTASFWTGVDIPGEALSTVIITRIPFAVPTYPLNQAKMERIESRGGNSFFEFSLPEAILKFRQGFGRLIRSKSDRGCVVILDKRVVTTRYGQQFLDSVPMCKKVLF